MAWTGIARQEHSRKGLRYSSDMTDPEWALAAPSIPAAKRGGRRQTTDMCDQPDVWISDRYAGQQELSKKHQICLAHVLRDVQYAIDCGDRAFAPKVRDHLRWAIRIGKQLSSLKDTTLAAYCAKADTVLTRLMRMPIARTYQITKS